MKSLRYREEAELAAPLLRYLQQRRRVTGSSLIAEQVSLHGKWIDLVTLTSTRILTAYELKLNHVSRVLEQAAANTFSVDRSYLVTASRPRENALEHAELLGVGILWVSDDKISELVRAPRHRPIPQVRARLVAEIRRVGVLVNDV